MKTRLAIVLTLVAAAITATASPALAATATLTAPASADVGETVTATVTVSDVPIVAVWFLDWGDGTETTQVTPDGTYTYTHAYNEPGDYDITVTIDDTPVTTTITINTYQGSFADDDNSTFVNDIEWLAAEGITKGCNPPHNTLFCPTQVVTRGQMAAFLSRALGYSEAPSANFTDTVGHTFEADIDKLADAGVTLGCNPPDNTMFCPNDPVTRGQMAAFLVRAFGYVDVGDVEFIDIAGNIFETNVLKLATAGVTRGCNPPDNTLFCPHDSVTRGQMAAFLHRAMGD
ncbi:MAG: S-layer homology domain-containing protein [Acidimicrobiia bacterium]|nr:S-layer homology domain-containing protein [Acidimicrobiia bacterium]